MPYLAVFLPSANNSRQRTVAHDAVVVLVDRRLRVAAVTCGMSPPQLGGSETTRGVDDAKRHRSLARLLGADVSPLGVAVDAR